MRVFVALPAPANLVAALDRAVSRVRIPGRVAARAQWHVTLAFAADWRSREGDPDDGTALLAACEAADRVVGPVHMSGPGAFPNARAARVLWFGFEPAPLAGLAAHFAPVFAAAERREFKPHLTLARLRRPEPVRDTLDALAVELPSQQVRFEELVLYRSHLGGREGARHEPLWRGSLA